MTGRRLIAVALALSLLLAGTAQAQSPSIPIIIKLAPGARLLQVLDTLGGRLVDEIPGTNIYLVNVPRLPILQPVLGLLGSLLQRLGLEWLEVNAGVPQPSYGRFGVLQVPAQAAANWYKDQPAMQLIRANHAQTYATGLNIVIADINSEIDYAHPALRGHLTGGYDFVATRPAGSAALNQSSASFMDQSSASFMDSSTAAFLNQSSASFMEQSSASFMDAGKPAYSHSTLTAGIIAAIAPDAMIMPLRTFNGDGEADLFILAKAIRHAVDHGAQVINMSFGTLENSKALKDSIDYAKSKGVILVASAGNANTSTPQYPAAFSGVLTTAATTLSDVKASFSNYGNHVFADAPGVNIISAYPGGRYAMVSGTSFSAPAVAATAALIRSIRTSGVSNSISSSAVDIDYRNPDYRNKLGYGRIDVLRAVKPTN